jgi:hypothetical protein
MRSESEQIFEALAEMRRIAEESGAHIHISHFKLMYARQWGRADELLAAVDNMRAAGSITCDLYPYCATSTGLTSLLPQGAKQLAAARIIISRCWKRTVLRMRLYITECMNRRRRGRHQPRKVLYLRRSAPSGRGEKEGGSASAHGAEDAIEIPDCHRCGATAIYYAMNATDVLNIADAPRYIAVSLGRLWLDISALVRWASPHPRMRVPFTRFCVWRGSSAICVGESKYVS